MKGGIGQLMKQAQEMQENMKKAQDEIVELRNIINMVTEEEFVDKKSVSD